MSLAVPLILWAGLKLGVSTNPEYFTLGLGLTAQSEALTLLAFVGGLSASSGLIIVSTLALSGMALNHLVLPLYQPPTEGNIYRWLKWTRRSLILTIIMAGYGFYLLLGAEQDLSNLGIVAFVATLQFLPGVLSVLYWPSANRRGYIAGLLAGIAVWVVTMLLPLVGNLDGIYIPLFNVVYVLDDTSWHLAAIASLAVNVLAFSLFSLFTETSAEEQSAAEACAVENIRRPQRRELTATSPQEFAEQLAKPLGGKTAQREVEQALRDLQLPFDEHRPYALRRLRDRIEANLSGLMGPSVAQDIVENFLPYKNGAEGYVTEDIHFIENRLEEYHSRLTGLAAELDALRRYHRQTLQDLPMGVCSLAKDQEVLMWNRALEELTGIAALQVVGSRLTTIDEPWRSLLTEFIQQPDEHLHKQRLSLDGDTRWLNLHKAAIDEPLAPGNSGAFRAPGQHRSPGRRGRPRDRQPHHRHRLPGAESARGARSRRGDRRDQQPDHRADQAGVAHRPVADELRPCRRAPAQPVSGVPRRNHPGCRRPAFAQPPHHRSAVFQPLRSAASGRR